MNNSSGSEHHVLPFVKSRAANIKRNGGNLLSTFKQRLNSVNKIAQANEEISKGIGQQVVATDRCTRLASSFQEEFETMLASSKVLAEKAQLTDRKISSQLVVDKKTQQHFFSIMESVSKLSASAVNVSGIIKTILRIAQQINLLSINASIEAARAGAAGRGFAAVAEEIKRLTHETKQAAEDISELIMNISSGIHSVQKLSDDASVDFLEQERKIERSNHALAEIHQAMDELVQQQKQVSSLLENLFIQKNELVDSVSQIAAITEHNAATSQMVSSISMEQSCRNDLVLDMLHTQQRLIDSLDQEVAHIEAEGTECRKLKIGFTSLEQQQFYDQVEEAARVTAESLNLEIICQSPKRYNTDEQIRIFREFMEQKVNGIVVVAGDANAFIPVINKAQEQGIFVACVDIDVPKSKRNLYITSDSYDGGKLAGEAAIRHLKGRGKIISLLCAAAVPTVQQRYQGFIDVVSQHSEMVMLKKEEQDDTDPIKSRHILDELIRRHPDFDLLYLVNSDAGEIAIDIWKTRRLGKKLIILSKSGKVTEAVRSGIVSSQIIQRNTLWGELAVAYISRLLNGENVPPYVNTGMYELNKANLPIFEKYGNGI